MLQTYHTRLSVKTQLTPDVYHLHFELIEPRELTFIPGQYMIMLVPQANGEPVRRLYSIVSPDSQKNSFELIIKIEPNGKASTYVLNMLVGDRVIFQGPAGVFRLKDNSKENVFLATGCGIAPMRSILLSVIAKNNNILYRLFWGLPTYKDVYMLDELKNFQQRYPNFQFTVCLSREQNLAMVPENDRKYFAIGHITDCFATGPTAEYYLCGSRHVTDSLKEFLLKEKAISPDRVVFEKF